MRFRGLYGLHAHAAQYRNDFFRHGGRRDERLGRSREVDSPGFCRFRGVAHDLGGRLHDVIAARKVTELLERSVSKQRLADALFENHVHEVLLADEFDHFAIRPSFPDHVPHHRRQRELLDDDLERTVSLPVALLASARGLYLVFFPIPLELVDDMVVNFHAAEILPSRKNEHVLRAVAEPPDETLVQYRDDRGRNEPFRHAQLDEADDGSERVLSMEGGKHQVSGEGRLRGDLRRFRIADFANQNNVGVLSQNRPDGDRVGKAPRFVDGRLVDELACPVLDRIFERDDVDPLSGDMLDGPMEHGRLSRTGGAGNQDDAVFLVHHVDQLPLDAWRKVGVVQTLPAHVLEQHAHDELLAVDGRHRAYADVDDMASEGAHERSVLGEVELGDVEAAGMLDHVHESPKVLVWKPVDFAKLAVDAHPHRHLAVTRLDVDVRRAPQNGEKHEFVQISHVLARLRGVHSRGGRCRGIAVEEMVESLLDRRGITDVRAHLRSRLLFYPFDEFLIERIGHHHRKMAAFFRRIRLLRPVFRRNGFDIENGERARFGPKGLGDAIQYFFQFRIQSGKIVPGNVEVLDAELPRYGHEDRLFVDESAFDQHFAEGLPTGMFLGGKRLFELLAGDEPLVDEDFSDFQPPSNVFHRLGEDLFRNPTLAHENVAKLASGSFLLFESLFQLVRSDVSLFGKYFADGPVAKGRGKSGSRGLRFRLRSELAAPYAFRRAFRRIRGVGVPVVIHAVGHAVNYAESAENIKRVRGGVCERPSARPCPKREPDYHRGN